MVAIESAKTISESGEADINSILDQIADDLNKGKDVNITLKDGTKLDPSLGTGALLMERDFDRAKTLTGVAARGVAVGNAMNKETVQNLR